MKLRKVHQVQTRRNSSWN